MRGPEPRTARERFWEMVSPEPTSGCWLWTGADNGVGYGKLFLRRDKSGKVIKAYAHRFSYEIANGPIPDDLTIDHLCRNPPCVNPAHLEAVTQRENNLRSSRCGQPTCRYGHPYTPENTGRNGRGGAFRCLTCKRERNKARNSSQPLHGCTP